MSDFFGEYVSAADNLLEALSSIEEIDMEMAEKGELSPAEQLAINGIKNAIGERVQDWAYNSTAEEPDEPVEPVIPPQTEERRTALELMRRPRFGVSQKPVEHRPVSARGEIQFDTRTTYEILSERVISVVSTDVRAGSMPDLAILDDNRILVRGAIGKDDFEQELNPADIVALNLLLASREDGISLSAMLEKLEFDNSTPTTLTDEFKTGFRAIRNLLGEQISREGNSSSRTYKIDADVTISDLRHLSPVADPKKKELTPIKLTRSELDATYSLGLRPAQRPIFAASAKYFDGRPLHEVRGQIVLPTGSGKTVLFTELLKQHPDLRALIVVPTDQLLKQTYKSLIKRGYGDSIGVVNSMVKDDGQHQIMLSTYQGLVIRGRHGPPAVRQYSLNPANYQVVILDEAHHALAEGAQQVLRTDYQHAAWMGYTATADYNEYRKLISLLPDVVAKLSPSEAASQGLIAPWQALVLALNVDMSSIPIVGKEFEAKSVNRVMNSPAVNETIARFFKEYFPDNQAIFNHSTIKHSESMAATLRAIGIKSRSVHGRLHKKERDAILGALEDRELQVVSQAKVVGEGFDNQGVSLTMNVSPTLSSLKELQRGGRAMRIDTSDPDKVAWTVDCVGDHYRREPVTYGIEEAAGSSMGGWDIATAEQHARREAILDALEDSITHETDWGVPVIGKVATAYLHPAQLARPVRPLAGTRP